MIMTQIRCCVGITGVCVCVAIPEVCPLYDC